MIPNTKPTPGSILDLFGVPEKPTSTKAPKKPSAAFRPPSGPRCAQTEDEAARAVLASLRAHPEGIRSVDLIAQFGPATKSRVGDLRGAGWPITTSRDEDGVARYRLDGERDEAAGADRTVEVAVRVVRYASGRLEVRPYGTALDGERSEELAAYLGPLVEAWMAGELAPRVPPVR